MEDKIHRAVVSAYCTLMLSSAFLTVVNGVLSAGAVNDLQAVEASTRESLASVESGDLACPQGSRPAPAQTAQGAPVAAVVNVRAFIPIVRRTGGRATLEDDLARELGIPLNDGEKEVEMKARVFSNGEITRKIFIPADNIREFVTFIVDGETETRLFLATADGTLRKAIVNTDDGAIKPIVGREAEDSYKFELYFWQEKLGAAKVAPAKNPATGG